MFSPFLLLCYTADIDCEGAALSEARHSRSTAFQHVDPDIRLGHIHSYARFMQSLKSSSGDVFNDDLMRTRRK